MDGAEARMDHDPRNDRTDDAAIPFSERLTKSQVVERIRTLNSSAPREWLERFDYRTLEAYLGRLTGPWAAAG